MRKIMYLLLIGLAMFSSCEKLLFEKDMATYKPKVNFDYFWSQCNENYSYFDVKGVDWKAVKNKYEPLIYEGMTEDSLFSVMARMLGELNDGHANLYSYFNTSYNYVIYSGKDNYDRRIVFDNYLSEDEYVTGPFRHNFIAEEQVGYIRFDRFTQGVNNGNLDFVLNRYAKTKGLIFDIRENQGGAISDVFKILSRFTNEETLIYYTRVKKPGMEHNVFFEATPAYIQPSNHLRYSKKVMVLIDRETYSAASFFTLATKALPNLILIGDTTGGGLGSPNGGQLPNGWTYRFPITQTLTLDHNPDYENGVPPDIYAEFDWNDRSKDEIIERALTEILK